MAAGWSSLCSTDIDTVRQQDGVHIGLEQQPLLTSITSAVELAAKVRLQQSAECDQAANVSNESMAQFQQDNSVDDTVATFRNNPLFCALVLASEESLLETH